MMARLAFVIAFEHFVFGVTAIIMWLIPDVPKDISVKLRREEYRVCVEGKAQGPWRWSAWALRGS